MREKRRIIGVRTAVPLMFLDNNNNVGENTPPSLPPVVYKLTGKNYCKPYKYVFS